MENLEHFIHEFSKVKNVNFMCALTISAALTIFAAQVFRSQPCLPLYVPHFFTLKISNHFKAANRPLFLDELKQRITDLNYVKGKLHRVA